jgi:hypothetical protein
MINFIPKTSVVIWSPRMIGSTLVPRLCVATIISCGVAVAILGVLAVLKS